MEAILQSAMESEFPYVACATASLVAGAAAYFTRDSKRPLKESKSPRKNGKRKRAKKKSKKKKDVRSDTGDAEANVVRALVNGALEDPDRVLYTFLDDFGKVVKSFSVKDVHESACAVACEIQKQYNVEKGDRVLLCFPPGLDFAIGFWGCLYAGAIAVPCYPPYPGTIKKDLPKFNKLCKDSEAKLALTNRTYLVASKMATVKDYIFTTGSVQWPKDMKWMSVDGCRGKNSNDFEPVKVELDDMAFFQYSSGSTSDPKAIMISYRNIEAQLKTWQSIQKSDVMVSWLPSYHDMGLIGFIVVPAWTMTSCVSMSPISFIKDPSLWIQVASKYKATHICAPNFGYALAARKTPDHLLQELDLSNLKQAICAAEPIREEALFSFYDKFKSCGFKMDSFNCGYGLAEVTLVCTGQDPLNRSPPTILTLDKDVLESSRIATDLKTNADANVLKLVGCGQAAPTFTVKIVCPDSLTEVEDNHIGELWVSGPSVACGYHGKPLGTAEAFRATLGDELLYLRTGDLGFCRDGEFFITGRIKDLIIIRGRNVCPQDVELSMESAHSKVRPGCTAAFSVEQKGLECLAVVAEVRDRKMSSEQLDEIVASIQHRILADHQLSCFAIALLKPHSIPKTTSGKIQRHRSRQKFLDDSLSALEIKYFKSFAESRVNGAQLKKAKAAIVSSDQPGNADQGLKKSPLQIEQWLMGYLNNLVDEQEESSTCLEQLSSKTPWASFGLESIALVSLSADFGDWLGVVVPTSAFFDYSSPHALANAPGLAEGMLQSADSASGNGDLNLTENFEIKDSYYKFEQFPELLHLQDQMDQLQSAGLDIPYLDVLDDDKRKQVNYNTYNYLGFAGHPEVSAASKAAIDKYGTSMSSSPIVGQTQINDALEAQLCKFYQAESSVLFVGGWVANVTTIDAIMGPKDLILCDALNHNSIVTGQRLSGATIIPFPHNDWKQADKILSKIRSKYRRVLFVIEGVYSMDGDAPDLAEFVRVKKKHKAILFLDEAHSFGTMGATGRGLCEHSNVDPNDVDIRMGTMSKAMGSTGGFILGSAALIRYLKYTAGGFVFSVGLTPANSASALTSLQLIEKNPDRVKKLQNLSVDFFAEAKKAQLNVCDVVSGAPVIVVIVGSTVATVRASMELSKLGINVKPIVHPAVEEGKCRLRFFLSTTNTIAQNRHTVKMVRKVVDKVNLK